MVRIFGCFLLLWIVSWGMRDRLPPVSAILSDAMEAPVQAETDRSPFSVTRNGKDYRIVPVASYALTGLVVSHHDSGSYWDYYHRLWGDELNFRDLGVVWGSNATSGIYRDMKWSSRDFTLNYSTGSDEVWRRFREDEVSNNHILAGDPAIEDRLRAIRPGDQITLQGMLCEYSHAGGDRGTSVRRDDRGNGACETIYVESAVVLREGNAFWRGLYSLSRVLTGATLAVLFIQAWRFCRSTAPPAGARGRGWSWKGSAVAN